MSRTIKLVTLILCLASPLATAQTIVLENEFARATFDPDPMSPYGWHLASIEQLDGTAPVGSSVWPAGQIDFEPGSGRWMLAMPTVNGEVDLEASPGMSTTHTVSGTTSVTFTSTGSQNPPSFNCPAPCDPFGLKVVTTWSLAPGSPFLEARVDELTYTSFVDDSQLRPTWLTFPVLSVSAIDRTAPSPNTGDDWFSYARISSSGARVRNPSERDWGTNTFGVEFLQAPMFQFAGETTKRAISVLTVGGDSEYFSSLAGLETINAGGVDKNVWSFGYREALSDVYGATSYTSFATSTRVYPEHGDWWDLGTRYRDYTRTQPWYPGLVSEQEPAGLDGKGMPEVGKAVTAHLQISVIGVTDLLDSTSDQIFNAQRVYGKGVYARVFGGHFDFFNEFYFYGYMNTELVGPNQGRGRPSFVACVKESQKEPACIVAPYVQSLWGVEVDQHSLMIPPAQETALMTAAKQSKVIDVLGNPQVFDWDTPSADDDRSAMMCPACDGFGGSGASIGIFGSELDEIVSRSTARGIYLDQFGGAPCYSNLDPSDPLAHDHDPGGGPYYVEARAGIVAEAEQLFPGEGSMFSSEGAFNRFGEVIDLFMISHVAGGVRSDLYNLPEMLTVQDVLLLNADGDPLPAASQSHRIGKHFADLAAPDPTTGETNLEMIPLTRLIADHTRAARIEKEVDTQRDRRVWQIASETFTFGHIINRTVTAGTWADYYDRRVLLAERFLAGAMSRFLAKGLPLSFHNGSRERDPLLTIGSVPASIDATPGPNSRPNSVEKARSYQTEYLVWGMYRNASGQLGLFVCNPWVDDAQGTIEYDLNFNPTDYAGFETSGYNVERLGESLATQFSSSQSNGVPFSAASVAIGAGRIQLWVFSPL